MMVMMVEFSKQQTPGTNWADLSGTLAIGQIAGIGASQQNIIMTGWQDNGSNIDNSGTWSIVYGGDGCEAIVDPITTSIIYESYVQGTINRSTNSGSSWTTISTATARGETGEWITPYVLHPTTHTTIYAGYANLWKSTNSGTAWTKEGTITGGTGSLLRIAVAQSAPTTVYVIKTDKIFKTINEGAAATWTDITGTLAGYSFTDIVVKNTDPNTVWVTVSGYNSGCKVYKSTDGGTTWTNYSSNLPNIPFDAIIADKNNVNDGVYVGADMGVYYRDNLMPNWALYNSGLPNAVISELEIYYDAIPANSRLRAGTYGRGLWQSELYTRPSVAPVAGINADKTSLNSCTGYVVNFQDASDYVPTSWAWSFPGGTPSTSTLQNPSVTYPSTPATYSVSLTATNSKGSSSITKTNYITVGEKTAPLEEDFTSTTYPPDQWTNSIWRRGTAIGASGSSGGSAYFNCYNLSAGTSGSLTTMNVDLTGITTPVLKFDVAYRQYATEADQLQVFISNNCGGTWTSIYNKSGATLATVTPASTANFAPSAAGNWRLENISLAAYLNQKVMIKFTGTSQYGNNIWVDDIFLGENVCAVGAAGAITGTTTLCQGTSGVAYSVPAITGATGYVWTLPSGATIASGNNTRSITVDYSQIALSGNITVKGKAACGSGAVSAPLPITVNQIPSAALPIVGPDVCTLPQTGLVYQIPYITNYTIGQTGYVWTLPSGGTITAGNNTNKITVNFAVGSTPGNIVVYGQNGCGVGASSSLMITMGLPAAPGIITGYANVCKGDNEVPYSVVAVPGADSYVWSLPTGATIASGSGTNSITVNYSASAVSGNISVAAVNTCGTGASSPLYAVTVDNIGAVAISIAANPGTIICAGASITFTATPTNGGTTPIYQWKVNGSNVGTNSSTYASTTLTNGQIVTCVLTSSSVCATGSPATSNTLTMTVNPILPVSISIAAVPAGAICSGTSVTFTATPTNGGATPAYQWKLNGTNVGANSTTYTNAALANGDLVTCVLTSNATPCATGSPATSNTVTMAVNSNLPVSVSIAAVPAGAICVGTSITFTATPTNGGATPAYQWKVNGVNVGTNSTTYSSTTLANGDLVTCVLMSNATCPTGNPATSNTVTMTVNPNLPVSVSVAAVPAGAICVGTSVTFTATPTNGGATPTYQWKLNGANVGANSTTYTNATLANGDLVTCVLTSSASPCATGSPATSNTVTMTVNSNLPVSVSIAAVPAGAICSGTSVIFTATPTNGGGTPAYQWKLNGTNVGANSTTYTNAALANGDMVTCVLTSNATCATGSPATSNTVTMTVNPNLPVSVSVSAVPAGAICAGTSVTFTATPTNGGATPTYQWKLNGTNVGTNSTTYSNAALTNGDLVTCVLTSSASPCATGNPATSNILTMSVNVSLPVSVSIAAVPAGAICSGTSVTFTATPTNGGGTPAYQWKLNGANVGANSPTYTNAALANGDMVTCVLTSNVTCATGSPATSNTVTMSVNPNLPVSVSIAAVPAVAICSGTSVTFTATPTNGGATPAYQWKLNGANVGANSTTYTNAALANGDLVTCVLTSSAAPCATGSPATSNTLTMSVNASLPVSVSIAAVPSGAICVGTSVTFTATPTNGGGTPAYQWKLNGSNVGVNSATFTSTTLVNGDLVTCVLTSNVTCPTGNPATSNIVTMTVNPILPVSVSIAAVPAGAICSGTSVTFTATPTNGGATPAYQWKLNGTNVGANSATYTNAALANGDLVTCVLTSSAAPCATGSPATSNTLTMSVNASLPVSVSIAAVPSGAICVGTSVTFTATPTNGGGTPAYQWKLNGSNVGVNSATFTSTTLVNGDLVTCVLTSNVTCPTGNPATSNIVTMTVNPILPVSVSIAAVPAGAICSGTSVTFTATPTNGGATPAYQWKLNGTNVGANSATYTNAALANGDLVTCVLTSSSACVSSNPATSNTVTMAVNPNLPVSVSIAAVPAGAICSGTSVTFTATPTNGGGTPAYQWKLNGANVGANSITYTNTTLINGDIITCVLTSNATCATGSPATSNTVTMTVNPNLPVSVSIAAVPAGAICSGTSVTFTATPTNGGGTPAYQWKLNGTNIGANSATYTNAALNNGDLVTCVLTSNATCATGSPATSNTVTMTVNPNLPVSVSIAAVPVGAICSGTSVTFTATPTNGGGTPAYQWKLNGTNVGANSATYTNAALNNGDLVTCVLTSNATCATGSPATSNTVTMTVNPVLVPSVSIAITTGSNPTCAGSSITFTATPTNGGTTPSYQWQVNGVNTGINSTIFTTTTLVNGDIVTCIMTSNSPCASPTTATSSGITITVNATLVPSVSIAITAGANPMCAGSSVTFTATPANGGTTPSYQWQINGVNTGTNSATFTTTTLVNGDIVTCVMTSNATCASPTTATSAGITMTVNSTLVPAVSIAITAGSNPTCASSSITFTATPTNGGTTPSYQWQVNGVNTGINSTIFTTTTLVNGDIVTCIMTSNSPCASPTTATSSGITITVNATLVPSVSIAITAGANPMCIGSSVTFTATPTNGGTTPSYQWQVNGVNTGINSTIFTTTTLVNGDIVTCIMTSNSPCASPTTATSSGITITVNATLVPSVSIAITAGANPMCIGSSVTFTATPTNGGATPAYQWKLNGANVGANSTTYTNAALANGDIITCVMTSSSPCASPITANSAGITMTVNPVLTPAVSIAITAGTNPMCAGSSITFTATPTNGGATPAYQWQVNGVNAGTNSTTFTTSTLTNGQIVTCVLTSNATCASPTTATSAGITMTVNPNLPVSVSIAAVPAGAICSGTSVTFTATPTNGGATPAYQWKLNGTNVGANSATYTNAALANGDLVTCVLTSSSACVSSNPATSNTVTMAVNPNLPVSVSIAAVPAGAICSGTSVTFTATPTNGGATPAYQWKLNGTNVGANSPTYTNAALANGNTITCVLTSNATCATGSPATSNTVTMTVNPSLPVSVSIAAVPAGAICSGTSVTFTATPTNGGGTPAYQWKLNGANVGANSITYTNTTLINGDIITCVLTSNATCATGSPATSNTVTMTVNPNLPVSVSIAAVPAGAICSGTSVTFTAIPTNGGGTPVYQWFVNGTPIGINSNTYSSASFNNADLVSCQLTSNEVCVSGSPASSNVITMTVNPNLPASVSITASVNPICAGTNVTFTAVPVNGGTTPVYKWFVNGTPVGINSNTYSSASLNNADLVTCQLTSNEVCVTGSPASSNVITMTVNPNLPASVNITASVNPICAGTNVTFTAVPVNGGTTPVYQWFVNGAAVGINSNTYSSATLNNADLVTCQLTSNEVCVSGNPATSNIITMAVNPVLPVSISIGASSNPICTGTTVTFTATAINGGTTPVYQWFVNGNPVGTNSDIFTSSTIIDSDVITCELTSNEACTTGNPSTSNSITMSVSSVLTADVSISIPDTNICNGTMAIFTATPVNGGLTPSYQWYLNGIPVGINSDTYSTNSLVNGDVITCDMTSSLTCVIGNPAASNAITMSVNPALPVSVSITASPNPVCNGTLVTFTASPINGGTTPTYQWLVNGVDVGVNSSTYTTTSLANSDQVYCILNSSEVCTTGNPDSSNVITMVIYPTPATPVITQNFDTLVSSAPYGNQWYYSNTLLSGATNQTYVPIDTGNYFVIVTDSNGCVSDTSNIIHYLNVGISNDAPYTGFIIYPNPNNGTFTIQLNSDVNEDIELRILNVLGETVIDKKIVSQKTDIDISDFAVGVYFAKIFTAHHSSIVKMLIQK
jgi:hypothetical protein